MSSALEAETLAATDRESAAPSEASDRRRALMLRWLNQLQKSDWAPYRVRHKILALMGAKLAYPLRISCDNHFYGGAPVIGRGVFINTGCFLDCRGLLTIEENAHLGPHCRILTSSHEMGDSTCRASSRHFLDPVRIGRGAWLGAGVTVLPGVTIGPGSVVGAGSVVVRDTEADSLYIGAPARRVRALD